MDSLKASCVSIVIHLVCYIKIIWKGGNTSHKYMLGSIWQEKETNEWNKLSSQSSLNTLKCLTSFPTKIDQFVYLIFLVVVVYYANLIYVYLLCYSYNALIFTTCIPMFDILSRSIGGWSPERNEFMLCWVRRVKVTTCLIQFIS